MWVGIDQRRFAMKTKKDVHGMIFGTKNTGASGHCGRPIEGAQFCSRDCFEDAGFYAEGEYLSFKGHMLKAEHANFFKD